MNCVLAKNIFFKFRNYKIFRWGEDMMLCVTDKFAIYKISLVI
jgi:hypothetical protein